MIVKPETFLVGYTTMNLYGMRAYLRKTGQTDFLESIESAMDSGLSLGEILCSFYAKMCYNSLVLGRNANVSRVRDISDNIRGCFETGHGSVFEHLWLNFVTTDCSRVLTHELVRHRVGVAYSQQSGRYCRLDGGIKLVATDDELLAEDGVADELSEALGLIERSVARLTDLLIKDGMSMKEKKRRTSFIRRIAPCGIANEMGWSMNIRAVRRVIQMRTDAGAEHEIRVVFNQVADIISSQYPLMLHGGLYEMVDGQRSWKGLIV